MKEARRQPTPPSDEPPRLRAVFEEHGDFVCRSLRMLGVLEADLDDVLQEVFLVVYQRLPDYEERGSARAWLYSICTRVSRAQRRKLRRREVALGVLPEVQASATQLERLTRNEAVERGQALLQRLPRDQRDVFWLYEVEELPMTQIAQAIGCPLQTAYSRLRKARQRILAEVQRTAATELKHA